MRLKKKPHELQLHRGYSAIIIRSVIIVIIIIIIIIIIVVTIIIKIYSGSIYKCSGSSPYNLKKL